VPGLAQFLDAKMQDLTPFLSGDAIKDYPNLAAHPTGVWRTTVYNNKIYGVGDPLAPFFWVHWHHQELLEAAGLQPPKNIDAAVRDGPVQSRPRIRSRPVGVRCVRARRARLQHHLRPPGVDRSQRGLPLGWQHAGFFQLAGRNAINAPVLSDQGRAEYMATTFQNIVNPPPVYFDPLGTGYVPYVIGVFKQYEAVGVEDPSIGFYSDSDSRQGVIANQRFGDGITDIVAGRRPLTDLIGLLQEWRTNGGDQVRKEYEDAMAAAG